jgi:hypothetical protein
VIDRWGRGSLERPAFGVELGTICPEPVVEMARERALAAYGSTRSRVS